MKKIFTLICAALLAASAFAETKTATIELTAASLGMGGTSTGGSAVVKASNDAPYTFAWTAAKLQDDGETYGKNIKMEASSYFYNVTEITGLKHITVENGGYYTSAMNLRYYVYTGTTAQPSVSFVSGGNQTPYDNDITDGSTFFNIKQGTSANMKFSKITITFEYEATGVEDVNVAKDAQVRKVIENGRVVIYNGDAKYDMMGARIK